MNLTNWEWQIADGERVFGDNIEFNLTFDVSFLNALFSPEVANGMKHDGP